MKRSHVIVLVLVILLAAVNFSYAGENAINIGGIYIKIGMNIDELKRILPAKYTLTNMDEVEKKIGAQMLKVPYTTYIIHSSDPDSVGATIYVVKNVIVVINRTISTHAGDEVMELGDSIYSAVAAALENKSSSMALVGVETLRISLPDIPTVSLSKDIVTIKIGKRTIHISVERGWLDKEIRGVSVSEVLGPDDLVEELLRKQPRNRIPEKHK